MNKKTYLYLCFAACLLAACGNETTPNTTTDATMSDTSKIMDENAVVLPTIMEKLETTASFKTFFEAMKQTKTDQIIKPNTTYTILVPTNESISKVVKGKSDKLLKQDNTAIAILLKNHIFEGKIRYEDLKMNKTLVAISGNKIDIAQKDQAYYANGCLIFDFGTDCSNGYIHVLDSMVLVK